MSSLPSVNSFYQSTGLSINVNDTPNSNNTSWLKTAGKITIFTIGLISSIASFVYLPVITAFLMTGAIFLLGMTALSCFSRCFPSHTHPERTNRTQNEDVLRVRGFRNRFPYQGPTVPLGGGITPHPTRPEEESLRVRGFRTGFGNPVEGPTVPLGGGITPHPTRPKEESLRVRGFRDHAQRRQANLPSSQNPTVPLGTGGPLRFAPASSGRGSDMPGLHQHQRFLPVPSPRAGTERRPPPHEHPQTPIPLPLPLIRGIDQNPTGPTIPLGRPIPLPTGPTIPVERATIPPPTTSVPQQLTGARIILGGGHDQRAGPTTVPLGKRVKK